MTDFTPGPWAIFHTGTINMIVPAMRDGMVADMIENKADARLIASAPDMLAVLQLVDSVIGASNPKLYLLSIVRAAIERATGGEA